MSLISASVALGRVRARRGDPGAFDVLDAALEAALPGGHLQRLGHVHAARAEAAWLAGERERTVDEAQAVYALALEKRHLWFAGELAYWQWKAGALTDAPEWIAEPYRLQLDGESQAAAAAWQARGLPVRGRKGARRVGGRGAAAGGAGGARSSRSGACGEAASADAANARRRRSPRAPSVDSCESGRADRA